MTEMGRIPPLFPFIPEAGGTEKYFNPVLDRKEMPFRRREVELEATWLNPTSAFLIPPP
jgi:hypothetical protein